MTWQMWIESAFEHFSIPFAVAFLVRYFTRMRPSNIVGWIILSILAIEVYQILWWGVKDFLVLVDTFMDIAYGLFGMWLGIEIAGDCK